MKVLDLFSGIGGFSLGLERAGMETVAFCEYDEKCRQVLTKHWPDIPQYEDVRTLTGAQLERDGIRDIGLICGGYPCQPFSLAGKRAGEEDDRHLWPEFFRLVQEIRPTWVLCENVTGHITMGLDSVLADLESEDYACQTFVIPACAVGAPHRRDRVWIVANNNGHGGRIQQKYSNFEDSPDINDNGEKGLMANAQGERCRETGADSGRPEKRVTSGGSAPIDVADPAKIYAQGQHNRSREEQLRRGCRWPIEPSLGRVANGVPRRVDRLKQLGNAVVPQIPEIIGRVIMEAI